MGIFTNHRLTLAAGFALAGIILGIGMAGGNGPDTGELIDGLVRWGHILSGITWVGLLYYLNFCQVPSLGKLSSGAKAELFADGGVVRRVMWWFRWASIFTLLFGLVLFMGLVHGAPGSSGSPGWDIRIGALLAIIMWFNVWHVIWPAQKRVLGIVEASDEEKAVRARRALIASRSNVILSIPMLLLMASSAHFRLFG